MDVTVVNTLADSYISAAPLSQAIVAEMAAEMKISKYSNLPANIIFEPVAFETLGSINQSGVDYISVRASLRCRTGTMLSFPKPFHPCSEIQLRHQSCVLWRLEAVSSYIR